jgi:uncharacterized protein DUF2752
LPGGIILDVASQDYRVSQFSLPSLGIDLARERTTRYYSPLFPWIKVREIAKRRQIALAGRERVLAAVMGFALLGPLALAGVLRPDDRGYGTHQQMGLLPCTLQVLFGVRCPTCGMTTSWANLVRGRPAEALNANLGGTLLCLLDILAVGWLFCTAIAGRCVVCEPRMSVIACGLATILVITLIEWAVRLICGC